MALKYGSVGGVITHTVGGAESPHEGLTIRFIPSAEYFTNAAAGVTVIEQPIDATTDAEGNVIAKDASPGVLDVQLLATDDPDLNPNNWTWIVTISGPDFFEISYAFLLPTDERVDLATVAPVPADPGKAIAEWTGIREATRAEWNAAVTAAQNAATDAAISAGEAAASAGTAAGHVDAAHAEAQAAAEARLAAMGFATAASAAQIAAEAARTGAVTARTGSESARTGAETARAGAEAARDLALAGQFAGSTLGVRDLDTVTVPGMYWQDLGTGTPARNYPFQGAYGSLEVLSGSNNATYRTQVFRPLNLALRSRGEWTRGTSDGVNWTPWRFIPTQRVDQTAGRAIYTWDDLNNREQLIYGDTGWRDISAGLLNGWTGAAYLRRAGSAVELIMRDLLAGTATQVVSVLNGFRPFAGIPVIPRPASSASLPPYGNLSGGQLNLPIPSTFNAASVQLTWSTTDPWPTTLPGTPVGSIPS